MLSGFPEGTTPNHVTVHLAQNVISTPKGVKSTPEGYFEVDFKSGEQDIKWLLITCAFK